jgi:hypothetical protein
VIRTRPKLLIRASRPEAPSATFSRPQGCHVQLLGDREYMDQILDGIGKVNDHLDEVRRYFELQGDQ